MFISHKYRAIFIHIQKTGGNSISHLFERLDPELVQELPPAPGTLRLKHRFAGDLQAMVSAEVFAHYTKFSVVRNPYDRLRSWYSMFKYQKTDSGITPGAMPNADRLGDAVYAEVAPYLGSFEGFLAMPNEGLLERFFYNQLDYLTVDGALAVDKVLRFESLGQDFDALAKQLGVAASLPHLNKSSAGQDYRKAYTEAGRQLVARRFQRDLEYFSYDF
jgi:hypothetical protein